MIELNLAAEPRVYVKNPSSRIARENVLLVVGARGEFVEPLLGYVDLAMGRASVDLFEAVGVWVDEARVD